MATTVNPKSGKGSADTLADIYSFGSATTDHIAYGYGGNDSMTFGSGHDTLDGGTGNDTMTGGAGNDTYIVDSTLDKVLEEANGGTDRINSTATLNLTTFAAQVEYLTLMGNAAINATGNALDNRIEGNTAANRIDGSSGNDTLHGFNGSAAGWTPTQADGNDTLLGGLGNDWLFGGTGSDSLDGGVGNDQLYGGDGNDTLLGREGNDTLSGDAGADSMDGGQGSDYYSVENAGDITKDSGTNVGDIDTVMSQLVSHTLDLSIENLTLGSLATNGSGTGNSKANTLLGNAGNNTLNGLTGNDNLDGGLGNDTLDGGTGNDTMVGGAGDDTYVVDTVLDKVTENAGEGTDRINTTAILNLNTFATQVEYLTLMGTTALNGTGNALDNVIAGNTAANRIDGSDGNDTIYGFNSTVAGWTSTQADGNDTLLGGLGNDWLFGGTGNDSMDGGADHDQLYAGDGNDTLLGGAGNDSLIGDTGADSMDGGQGSDYYSVENAGDIAKDTGTTVGDIDTVMSQLASFTLDASIESLTLGALATNGSGTGNGSANTLRGNAGNNTLKGLAGNDTLDGGAGIDNLDGGAGSDTYMVDNSADVAKDTGTGLGEVDTVLSSATDHVLDASIENITLIGPTAVYADGNASANVMTGNNADNGLSGQGGDDWLDGQGGHDDLYGMDGSDTLIGGAGDDVLMGGMLGIDAVGYDDFSHDRLDGGAGNDRYIINGDDDELIESTDASGGVDTIVMMGRVVDDYVLADGFEHFRSAFLFSRFNTPMPNNNDEGNLNVTGNQAHNAIYGTAGANNLLGLEGNDSLYGGHGDDDLDGGTGNDLMNGGNGDDRYYVDSLSDQVIELADGGTDQVYSTLSDYTLGEQVESLVLFGDADQNGTGNALANTLYGNDLNNVLSGGDNADLLIGQDGNDTLIGGEGADYMDGGLGDDLYRVDSSWDTVVEEFEDGGSDTIETTVDFTELGGNFENLILSGTSSSTTQVGWGNARNNGMAGNNLSNQLEGWDGNDLMGGRGGDDTLNGGGGNDTMLGGDGNDLLTGASGDDFMTGGNGVDRYGYDHGFGKDIINDGATDGAQDIVLFSSTMDYKTLWFTKSANNDLVVSQIGTSDQITVAGWFNSTQNHVELFEIGADTTYRTMTDSAVQGLVNAMASMTPPPAGQTSLTSAQWTTLQPAMDQAWLFPEIG